ncbi:hypothetical protein ACE4RV_15685 [Acetobacter persici]
MQRFLTMAGLLCRTQGRPVLRATPHVVLRSPFRHTSRASDATCHNRGTVRLCPPEMGRKGCSGQFQPIPQGLFCQRE